MQNPTNSLIQFMNLIKGGKNPQQMVINLLEQESENNPFMKNLLILAKENKTNEIEEIAKNMAKERGIDFEKEFTNFKQMLGM